MVMNVSKDNVRCHTCWASMLLLHFIPAHRCLLGENLADHMFWRSTLLLSSIQEYGSTFVELVSRLEDNLKYTFISRIIMMTLLYYYSNEISVIATPHLQFSQSMNIITRIGDSKVRQR